MLSTPERRLTRPISAVARRSAHFGVVVKQPENVLLAQLPDRDHKVGQGLAGRVGRPDPPASTFDQRRRLLGRRLPPLVAVRSLGVLSAYWVLPSVTCSPMSGALICSSTLRVAATDRPPTSISARTSFNRRKAEEDVHPGMPRSSRWTLSFPRTGVRPCAHPQPPGGRTARPTPIMGPLS